MRVLRGMFFAVVVVAGLAVLPTADAKQSAAALPAAQPGTFTGYGFDAVPHRPAPR